MFVACANNVATGKKPKGDKKKSHGAASSKSSKSEADNSSSTSSSGEKNKKKNQRKDRGCFLCNGNHFARECDELKFCSEVLSEKKKLIST